MGNPGEEYSKTRHNAGFMVLDALAKASNIFFKPDRLAEIAELKYAGKTLILAKPQTYMNLSGKAVRYWLDKEKIPISNLLIVADELNLDIGKIRIKPSGSAGGHNGYKSIQELLGHANYSRLKFGVGNNFPKGQQVDYVLGNFTSEEEVIAQEQIERSIKAIQSFVRHGIAQSMTEFNK